ncbi:MAG: MgtC/SapB family protein [Candidatus Binatia bacterium]
MIDLFNFAHVQHVQLEILGSVALAMLLGALIGIDREIANRPAGLRTHMLVAGAAALLVSLGDVLVEHFNAELNNNVLRSDPIRIIEAVVTGVSFLGAGTIIRGESNESVKGLTTAASLLFVAGVGICVALSQLVLAVGVTILVLIILRGLRPVERWLGPQNQP